MRIFLVYKTGGDYNRSHVERLVKQLRQHNKCEISVLTDAPGEMIGLVNWTYPLINRWQGWWSKLELFRFKGPYLFLDLDSTVVGPLDELWEEAQKHELVMLSDFYFPAELQSSVIGWNGNLREIYDRFYKVADEMMKAAKRRWSDQTYVEMVCSQIGTDVKRWQELLPERVCSYKVHVRDGAVPPQAVLVCFHGKPRPWDVPEVCKSA